MASKWCSFVLYYSLKLLVVIHFAQMALNVSFFFHPLFLNNEFCNLEYSVDYSVGVDSFCIGTACLKHTGFRALVDSGTSFTFLPADVYERVTVEVFSFFLGHQ